MENRDYAWNVTDRIGAQHDWLRLSRHKCEAVNPRTSQNCWHLRGLSPKVRWAIGDAGPEQPGAFMDDSSYPSGQRIIDVVCGKD
jgi:hypothetical protein